MNEQQPPQEQSEAVLSSAEFCKQSVTMRPMEFEDGRVGWYIDHPNFYCDLEPDESGVWSVFFRERNTGKEAYGERQKTPPTTKASGANRQLREAGETTAEN